MSDNIDEKWFKHLENLDNHYHPDNFFADQKDLPGNKSKIKDDYFSPGFTEETDIPEQAELSIDIFQDKENLYVIAPVSGIKSDSLDLSLEKDILTIKGERDKKYTASDKNQYLYQECYWGKFSRSIILPGPVKNNKIKAELLNGVLRIILPKEKENGLVRIKVKQED
ncbi:MAG TPA: Hsp20/alpha crystallin family protein [Patescibacteria group bacterium]|nr:Hsp20/alpha crystallin family protein [Patescibacteria group bacterium]